MLSFVYLPFRLFFLLLLIWPLWLPCFVFVDLGPGHTYLDIFESATCSLPIKKCLRPPVSWFKSNLPIHTYPDSNRICPSTRIPIQIKFAHPHVSRFKSNLPIHTYPDSNRICPSTRIRIQIEFAHPLVSRFKSNLPIHTYPDSNQICPSTRIPIQIEFAHPHVSRFKSNLPTHTYPDSNRRGGGRWLLTTKSLKEGLNKAANIEESRDGQNCRWKWISIGVFENLSA